MFNIKLRTKRTTTILAISLIALFAVSIASMASMTSAQIALPNPRKNTGWIIVAPTVVGVGQKATVNLWVDPIPQDAGLNSYFGGPGNGSYTGVTVTFTKPDGTKDTFAPTDGIGQYPAGVLESLGSMYFFYAPDMAGEWSVTMSMPAQNFTDATGTVEYTGCTSQPDYFTVTTEPQYAGLLNGYPWSELPNSNTYWTWPISANNREWAAIAGDFLPPFFWASLSFIVNSGGYWQPYGSAPNTAHIVWDTPVMAGGIVGGDLGTFSNAVYLVSEFPVIMNGKVYLNIPTDQYPGATVNKFECIDLATGKILWTAPGAITTGIHFPGNAYAQSSPANKVTLQGSLGNTPQNYLFGNGGTVWNFYDPNTGVLLFSFSNVTATNLALVDGSPLVFGIYTSQTYATGVPTGSTINGVNYVFEWNLTKVVNGDWQTGIVWTHTVNNPAAGIAGPGDGDGRYGIAVSPDLSSFVYAGENLFYGFDTKTGASIWNVTTDYVNQEIFTNLFGQPYFLTFDPTTATFYCYSDLTGALKWSSPNVGSYPFSTQNSGYDMVNDNNNVYLASHDGEATALSLADGHVVWQTEPINSTEYITNVLPHPNWAMMASGGNVYVLFSGETFYQQNPIGRFGVLECINATTGNVTFSLNSAIIPQGAVSGYVMGGSLSDGNYYCLGKGQTSTIVTAQQQVGGSVLIQGSVLDQSSAEPNTPAISDANMSVWMDYLHMQNATLLNNPPQCNGVQVTLTAVGPGGQEINLGTTTSNYQGNYGFQWTPTTPGLYTVYATFEGSNSYYPSSSSSYATVSIASATPTPTTAPTNLATTSDLMTYIIIAAIVIIIAIAIVGALLLRKKP